MLSKAKPCTIFESLVWLDLGLNPGHSSHWRTLYSLDQWPSWKGIEKAIYRDMWIFDPYFSLSLSLSLLHTLSFMQKFSPTFYPKTTYPYPHSILSTQNLQRRFRKVHFPNSLVTTDRNVIWPTIGAVWREYGFLEWAWLLTTILFTSLHITPFEGSSLNPRPSGLPLSTHKNSFQFPMTPAICIRISEAFKISLLFSQISKVDTGIFLYDLFI